MVDSCRRLRSAGMADGFLIDFLVLSQFFITTSPSPWQRYAAEGLIFWTRASQILLSGALACTRVLWGLIYERKSWSVQFLTAEADNGGGWMKQSVTSSSPLTFRGCWRIGLKGPPLRIDVTEWLYENRFFTIDSERMLRKRWMGDGEIDDFPSATTGIWVESESPPALNVMNVQ